jgi:hypothetical protein
MPMKTPKNSNVGSQIRLRSKNKKSSMYYMSGNFLASDSRMRATASRKSSIEPT